MRLPSVVLAGWLLSGAPAMADEVTICYNYDCATKAAVSIGAEDHAQLDQLFAGADDAATERESIRMAVRFMSLAAGAQTPIHNDKARNDNEDDVDGRMDCIDHSQTTTAYLRYMERHGWLQFHRVLEPIHRAPLLVNDHWSARIEDVSNGEQFAVDPWAHDFGEAPTVIPVRDWLRGEGGNG